VIEGVASVLKELGAEAKHVVGIGLANQGETVCAWDINTGQALYNAIVWSDARGNEQIDSVSDEQKQRLREITGLEPDCYFSAAKMLWMLENVPEVRKALEENRLAIGTLDSWLIWRLSGEQVYVTDHSTASRTMLYDLGKGKWSAEAAKIMGLPRLPLAEIVPSCGQIAELTHECWGGTRLGLRASLVDQPAALFGHGCWQENQAKMTYGTGCFILVNSGDKITSENKGLLRSVAWHLAGKNTLMQDGGVYAVGSLIGWLEHNCEWVRKAEHIDEMLADNEPGGDLIFVPCMDGLSAPYWRRDARGMLVGLSLATKPTDIIRAAVDGIAHQVADIIECVPAELATVRADGGLSACKYLMQRQADLLGVEINVSKNREMTALGAAAMAGLGTGVWPAETLLELIHHIPTEKYTPRVGVQERQSQRQRWRKAIELVLTAANI